jgi:hypothetical protein
MSRYSPYYLGQIIELEDQYCRYYVQNTDWCHRDILDVPHLQFFFEEEAQQWLKECIEAEPADTLAALRRYLSDHGQQGYLVHRMNDAAVAWAVAREITQHGLKVVIRPKFGAAVELPKAMIGSAYPFRLVPCPDIDTRFAQLQTTLESLLHHQRDRLSTLKAAADGDKPAEPHPEPGQIAQALGAFPGFHPGLIRRLSDIGHAPEQAQTMALNNCIHHSPGPISEQINAVAAALCPDPEQNLGCRTMLTTLLTDPETLPIVQDFAQRHFKATPEPERKKLGIADEADMLTAYMLAVALLTSSAHQSVAVRTPALAHTAEQMRTLATELRSTEPRRLPAHKPSQPEPEPAGRQDPFATPAPESWIEVLLLDDTGEPAAGIKVTITGPDGKSTQAVTRSDGTVRLSGIDPGKYELSFPEVDDHAHGHGLRPHRRLRRQTDLWQSRKKTFSSFAHHPAICVHRPYLECRKPYFQGSPCPRHGS